MRTRAAKATSLLVAAIVVIGMVTTGPTLAIARQAEGTESVAPPVSTVKPIDAAPWDLAPWTGVGLVAVGLCALLAWWIVGRDADPIPAGDDPDDA